MRDEMLVERVTTHLFGRREQTHGLSRDEPHEDAFALTDGTIARRDFRNFAFNLKSDLAAMAASLVFHMICSAAEKNSAENISRITVAWTRRTS
jgi:hypothetical protein